MTNSEEQALVEQLRGLSSSLTGAFGPPTWGGFLRRLAARSVFTAVPMGLVGLGAWGLGAEPLAALRVAIGGWACVGTPLALVGAVASFVVAWRAHELGEALARFAASQERP